MMINDRIIRLFGEYLSGEMSPGCQAELMSWVEQGEENRIFFQKVCQDSAFRRRWEMRQKIDVREAIRKFDRRSKKQNKYIFIRGRIIYSGVAAVVLLIMASVIFWLRKPDNQPELYSREVIQPGCPKAVLIMANGDCVNLERQDSLQVDLESVRIVNRDNQLVYEGQEPEMLEYNELRVPKGGEYRVVLSDGTTVRLNSNSSLKYPVVFGKERREVELAGEAYFDVVKSTVPFYVQLNDMTVKVYGTAFNVNTHFENRIQTALVEGKVGIQVKGTKKEFLLSPDQMAELDIGSGQVDIRQTDLAPYLAWTKGLFIFNNESLEQIMQTLGLWYDIEVFFQNTNLQTLHFTGCVKRYDCIDTILNALAQSVNVKFSQKGRTLVVYK